MSTSLPERPDLDQLRRQAKELRDAARRGDPEAVERFARHYRSAARGVVTLAAAQLVIARELGFASWPQLKAAVEARATTPERLAEVFVAASVDGRIREAAMILEAAPDIARYSLEAAAVLGDSRTGAARGSPSTWQRRSPSTRFEAGRRCCTPATPAGIGSTLVRAAGMAEVVRLLLDAGASPNTNNGARQGFRSALKGSVEVNNPDVARVLLEAGANPDLGRPIGEAAGLRDHRCLELLLPTAPRWWPEPGRSAPLSLPTTPTRWRSCSKLWRAAVARPRPGGDRGAARRGGGRFCRRRRRSPRRRSRPRGLRR